MSEKMTLQEIAALLAERQNIQHEDAEAFIKAFLTVTEGMLICDRYVRIKGFGTFKLLDAHFHSPSSMNAGNSNEGNERKEISFEPDAALRDMINKPFSQFETVQLKDGVHFDDMVEEAEEKPATIPETVTDQSPVPEPEISEPDPQKPRTPWWTFVAVLLIGVITGGGISLIYVHNRQDAPQYIVEQQDTAIQNFPDSFVREIPDTDPMHQEKPDPAPAYNDEKEILSDKIEYEICGTKTSYTLRPGESLAKVAQMFYGNRKLWPYLVRHNQAILSDPDRVPVGTTINIPVLVPKEK